MRCPNCGHDNLDDMRFCTACGAAITASGSGRQAGASRAPQASVPNVPSIFFMNYVIIKLSDGAVFRTLLAISLNALAVVGVILGTFLWLSWWRDLLVADEARSIVWVILYQLLYAVSLYMAVHTVFIRARQVANMESSQFILLPIASLLVKLQGELLAILCVFTGVIGGVYMWIFPSVGIIFGEPMLPPLLFWNLVLNLVEAARANYGSFVGGLASIFVGLLAAFVYLISSYLLSELISLIPSIARNTEAICRAIEQNTATQKPNP